MARQVAYSPEGLRHMRRTSSCETLLLRSDGVRACEPVPSTLEIPRRHHQAYWVIGALVDREHRVLRGIEIRHHGISLYVCAGFTEEQRRGYAQDPDRLVGTIARVTYQGESATDGTLLDPMVVAVYETTETQTTERPLPVIFEEYAPIRVGVSASE